MVGIEGYPKITRTVQPEGYDVVFTMRVNLSGATFDALIVGGDPLGPALVEAYSCRVYRLGLIDLDFTTPESALATLENADLPMDLRWWLRNAPIEAVDVYLEGLRKNFRRSFEPTST